MKKLILILAIVGVSWFAIKKINNAPLHCQIHGYHKLQLHPAKAADVTRIRLTDWLGSLEISVFFFASLNIVAWRLSCFSGKGIGS